MQTWIRVLDVAALVMIGLVNDEGLDTAAAFGVAQAADDLAVDVTNASKPTLCADVNGALTSGTLLPAGLYQQMIAGIPPDPADPTYTYGLGVEVFKIVCGGWVIGHTGGAFGYSSALFTDGHRTMALDMNIYSLRPQVGDAFNAVGRAEFCQ